MGWLCDLCRTCVCVVVATFDPRGYARKHRVAFRISSSSLAACLPVYANRTCPAYAVCPFLINECPSYCEERSYTQAFCAICVWPERQMHAERMAEKKTNNLVTRVCPSFVDVPFFAARFQSTPARRRHAVLCVSVAAAVTIITRRSIAVRPSARPRAALRGECARELRAPEIERGQYIGAHMRANQRSIARCQ